MNLARCHNSWRGGLFSWSSDDYKSPHRELIAATGNPPWEEYEQRLLRIVSYIHPQRTR